MAIAKKPTLVKSKTAAASKTAAKFVAGATSQSKQPGFQLVPYTFRLDQGLLDRVKAAAEGLSIETSQKVTVTSFMVLAILDKVKKCEAGQ